MAPTWSASTLKDIKLISSIPWGFRLCPFWTTLLDRIELAARLLPPGGCLRLNVWRSIQPHPSNPRIAKTGCLVKSIDL